ncbi:MAG: bifunctional aldolase/short-chain dehydrogenase [Desulfosudaceae bacterium]
MNQHKTTEIMEKYPGLRPDMAACLAITRQIGGDPGLVLHGGGNTSVKLLLTDIFGKEQEAIFVKASGRDMAGIAPEGFTGLWLEPLRRLRHLEQLSDAEMMNQLTLNRLDAAAPAPSVEALLHAFLPDRFIVHTHADAILALTNRENGRDLIGRVLGKDVIVLDYEMSGLPLAKKAARARERLTAADTIVVLQHGIFTLGETAEAVYERMLEQVDRADQWLRENQPEPAAASSGAESGPVDLSGLARVTQTIRGICGNPGHAERAGDPRRSSFLVESRSSSELVAASLAPEAPAWCDSGALTPDHVIRTKNQYVYIDRVPADDSALADLIREKVARYRDSYQQYFSDRAKLRDDLRDDLREDSEAASARDSCPRVFLIAGLGLAALGTTPAEARIAADIAEHTIRVKRLVGRDNYRPISEDHVFDMEYWPLQRQKIKRPSERPLAGKIALVTGAAGAIGYGIAERLLAAGAAVIVSDIDQSGLEKVRALLADRHGAERVARVVFDVTDCDQTIQALEQAGLAFGGLDILVPNAGTAYVATIEDIDPEKFQKVLSVNLMGCFNAIKAAVPVFRRQAGGGDIIVISSKNVFDPGAAFGAYSASKAGAHQIARIAALELAELGVRVNMVNPDAVFGDEAVPSKLWETIGPDRMKARGLDPEGLKEYYRQRNLLKVSVYAEHVGNAVVFFASGLTPTTGATLPVDGGVAAAFPR